MLNPETNTYGGLYRLLGTSCENWQCFQGKLAEPTQLYILLFKEISRDDGP
jgi:hypothetical protein